ncbi:hypothetical protein ACFPM0_29940 [Pseudonocardia sulfidoxydans]
MLSSAVISWGGSVLPARNGTQTTTRTGSGTPGAERVVGARERLW